MDEKGLNHTNKLFQQIHKWVKTTKFLLFFSFIFNLHFFFTEMIDDTDTYIVRDVLTDDIIFIAPEDVLNNSNSYDMLYDHEVNIYY